MQNKCSKPLRTYQNFVGRWFRGVVFRRVALSWCRGVGELEGGGVKNFYRSTLGVLIF